MRFGIVIIENGVSSSSMWDPVEEAVGLIIDVIEQTIHCKSATGNIDDRDRFIGNLRI